MPGCALHPQWVHDPGDCPMCAPTRTDRDQIAALKEELLKANRKVETFRALADDYQRQRDEGIEECRQWRTVAEYYLGDFALTATPIQARNEAVRRSLDTRPIVEHLFAWMKAHVENPFDHNGECTFCDEQGQHDPTCPFFDKADA
jgi:hypothetical protein